jgi:hypothetical protein
MLPKDQAAETRLVALQDAYLANPSWDSLNAMLDSLESEAGVHGPADLGQGHFFFQKYAATLQGQHLLYLASSGQGMETVDLEIFVERNNAWGVGDTARATGACESDGGPLPLAGCKGFPAELVEHTQPDGGRESEIIQLQWFWQGWIFDPGLQRTSGSNATKGSEYFSNKLWESDYLHHLKFHHYRKEIAAVYQSKFTYEAAPLSSSAFFDCGFEPSGFSDPFHKMHEARARGRMLPGTEDQTLFAKLNANSLRMILIILRDELTATGKAYRKDVWTPDGGWLDRMTVVLDMCREMGSGGTAAFDRQLIADVKAALASAEDLG